MRSGRVVDAVLAGVTVTLLVRAARETGRRNGLRRRRYSAETTRRLLATGGPAIATGAEIEDRRPHFRWL
jgi:hypothetical protein